MVEFSYSSADETVVVNSTTLESSNAPPSEIFKSPILRCKRIFPFSFLRILRTFVGFGRIWGKKKIPESSH